MASFSSLIVLKSPAWMRSLRKFKKKKCEGLISGKSVTHSSRLFKLIWVLIEKTLQLCMAAFKHNSSD